MNFFTKNPNRKLKGGRGVRGGAGRGGGGGGARVSDFFSKIKKKWGMGEREVNGWFTKKPNLK